MPIKIRKCWHYHFTFIWDLSLLHLRHLLNIGHYFSYWKSCSSLYFVLVIFCDRNIYLHFKMISFTPFLLLVFTRVLLCEEILFSEFEILNVFKMSSILSDSNFSTVAFLFDYQESDSLDTQFTFNTVLNSTTSLKAVEIINLQ
jgi:hypothetical protein